MTIDLHELTLPTLPELGPDVPGTPVEVTHPDGTVELSYAWRDGRVSTAGPDRERRTGPLSWGRGRITAVLADDPTRWVPVDADERVRLSEHLVGARVCSERDGLTVVGPAARVDEGGWVYAEGGRIIAGPGLLLRVHPADLAAAREKAQPPLPEEPPIGSVVLDRDGVAWQKDYERWESAPYALTLQWADLHRKHGPVAVIHRAAS